MIDLLLNIGFGLIGVVGFALAIMQYRETQKVTDVFEGTLEAIAQNANDYAASGASTESSKAFARQVQRQCYALIRPSALMSRYFVRFFPAEYSATWHTTIGKRVALEVEGIEPRAYRLVIAGRATEDGTQKLIYGPYETLTLPGLYQVQFNILGVEVPESIDGASRVIRIDVNGSNARLAEKYLTSDEVAGGSDYILTFRCKDPSEKMEYRIALLRKGVSASVYDVTIRRVGR